MELVQSGKVWGAVAIRRGGDCRATCMVLDKNALPLTRSWCLFEVLQTFKLQNEDNVGNFEGLYFCTDRGVIGNDNDEPDGSTSYDVALALARRLSTLRVQDARATLTNDEEMIKNLVNAEGGMDAMNDFVRGNMSTVLLRSQKGFDDRVNHLRACLDHAQGEASSRNRTAVGVSKCKL